MDQPVSKHAKSTLPNHSIGLNTEKIDEINIASSVMKFVSKKMMAPLPTATVGKCETMRMRVLQMSLFPDIYDRKKPVHPGNVDFGEMD